MSQWDDLRKPIEAITPSGRSLKILMNGPFVTPGIDWPFTFFL